MMKDTPNTNLIENQELAIKLYKAYEDLSKRDSFKTLIEEGFIKIFASNQVSLLNHPGTLANGTRAPLIDNLMAVSSLQNYLLTVEILGEKALNEKLEDQG